MQCSFSIISWRSIKHSLGAQQGHRTRTEEMLHLSALLDLRTASSLSNHISLERSPHHQYGTDWPPPKLSVSTWQPNIWVWRFFEYFASMASLIIVSKVALCCESCSKSCGCSQSLVYRIFFTGNGDKTDMTTSRRKWLSKRKSRRFRGR